MQPPADSPFSPRVSRGRSAFTLVELIVVVAITGVLAGLLIPAILAARSKARDSECLSNLRQVGVAIAAYGADNRSEYPPNPYGVEGYPSGAHRWYYLLAPYIDKGHTDRREQGSVFLCPKNRSTPDGYAYATLEDYGYLCNLQLMPRLDTGTPFSSPVRMASVTKRRILAADTIKATDNADKTLWVHYGNTALENSRAPIANLAEGRWDVHRNGIHALWTDYGVSWISVAEVNRPGSQIAGGQYFGRGN